MCRCALASASGWSCPGGSCADAALGGLRLHRSRNARFMFVSVTNRGNVTVPLRGRVTASLLRRGQRLAQLTPHGRRALLPGARTRSWRCATAAECAVSSLRSCGSGSAPAFASSSGATESVCDDAEKPVSYRLAHCVEIGAQAVIARHLHHRAPLRGRRHAERISRPLHDEHRDRHRIELREPALCRRGA